MVFSGTDGSDFEFDLDRLELVLLRCVSDEVAFGFDLFESGFEVLSDLPDLVLLLSAGIFNGMTSTNELQQCLP